MASKGQKSISQFFAKAAPKDAKDEKGTATQASGVKELTVKQWL